MFHLTALLIFVGSFCSMNLVTNKKLLNVFWFFFLQFASVVLHLTEVNPASDIQLYRDIKVATRDSNL